MLVKFMFIQNSYATDLPAFKVHSYKSLHTNKSGHLKVTGHKKKENFKKSINATYKMQWHLDMNKSCITEFSRAKVL